METDNLKERPCATAEGIFGSPDALAAYALVFGLMGKVLYVNPEREWLDNLALQGVFDEIPLDADDADVAVGCRLLESWFGKFPDGLSDAAVDEVRCDYVPLFLNKKDGASAPPWESVYVNSSPAFFQCSTMSVRMWYGRYRLETENREHEPDDHIGLELIFLGHLCSIAAGMSNPPVVDGGEYPLAAVRCDIAEFAQKHLLNWATHWCDIVAECARTDFYRGAALLTKGALSCFAADLGKEISPEVFR